MKNIFAVFVVFVLSSCASKEAVVTPESLLNSSSENVSFSVTNDSSVEDIRNWIKDDRPTRADISCADLSDSGCVGVKSVLEDNAVAYRFVEDLSKPYSVTLIYERVVAKDCSGGFGCASSVNMLKMVSGYKQFVSPDFTSAKDAESAVRVIEGQYSK